MDFADEIAMNTTAVLQSTTSTHSDALGQAKLLFVRDTRLNSLCSASSVVATEREARRRQLDALVQVGKATRADAAHEDSSGSMDDGARGARIVSQADKEAAAARAAQLIQRRRDVGNRMMSRASALRAHVQQTEDDMARGHLPPSLLYSALLCSLLSFFCALR